MSFTYNTGIPDPTHNPSVDAPNMQTNTNTINAWTLTDHIGFNVSTAGQHKQVTFNANLSSPSIPAGAVGLEYISAGTADATRPQLFFKNSAAPFLLSGIRAWALCNSGGIVSSQSFNVSSAVSSPGSTLVTLPSNIVSGTSYSVFVTTAGSTYAGYSKSSATQFTVIFTGSSQPEFSFFVMQI